MPVNPAQAAAELIRRRRARRSLLEYARSIDIPGVPVSDDDPEAEVFKPVESALALHHRVMLEAIERCVRKFEGRLIIMAPPGSAKSSYVSVVTPAWAMSAMDGAGKTEFRIILASYAVDLATKQSRRARALVKSDRHRSIFPRGTLGADQKAADEWKLQNGAEFMAAGFQSGITGNRADLLLIDDPVKNREDADSVTVREKVANEYRDSAKTRLKPGASIIVIMTSWSEADLIHGEILPEDYHGQSGMVKCRDGREWEVLNIPAEAEHADDPLGRPLTGPGRWLWPEWFPESHWLEFKNDPKAQRTWSALYQQRPSPVEGLQFTRLKARWYDPANKLRPPPGTPGYGDETNPAGPPKALRLFGASDYATTDEGGDFTEHGVAGMDPHGNLLLLDWWSGQRETDVSIAAFNKLVAKHREHPWSATPVRKWWNEGGPIDRAIKPAINRSMREYPDGKAYVSCEAMPSIQDKEIKLMSFHARYNAETVWFPIGCDWAQKVVDQLVKFPTGKHDDKADVCGLLGRGIDKMGTAAIPSPTERRQGLKPFTAAWLEYEEKSTPAVRYW